MLDAATDTRNPAPSRGFLGVLLAHKWKALVFFFLVALVVIVATRLAPDIYRSEARLMLRLGRENVTLDPTASSGQTVAVGQTRRDELNSELEILKSREIMERIVDALTPEAFLKPHRRQVSAPPSNPLERGLSKVTAAAADLAAMAVETLGLGRNMAARDAAILELVRNLQITAPKDSNIIAISFEAEDPGLAQETVTRLIDLYKEKHMLLNRTAGSSSFFAEQTNRFRDRFDQTQEKLRTLKNAAAVGSLEEQQRILSARIDGLGKELESTEASILASRAKVREIETALANIPATQVLQETTGMPNAAADGMRQRLFDLQLKEQDTLSRFTELNQQALEMRRQINEAKTLLNKEPETRVQVTKGLNTSYQQMQLALITERAELSSSLARAEALKGHFAAARSELTKLNNAELGMNLLRRDLSLDEENYRKYFDNLEQTRIDDALQVEKISNVSIVEPATVPIEPVRPHRALNLAVGLFLGLVGAIGLAFFSEMIDRTLKSPEEVRWALDLPTLVAMPYLLGLSRPARFVSRLAKSRGGAIPTSAERYCEALRDRVLLAARHAEAPVLIAVTGCRRGEGASSVATGLALMLARDPRKRILLVDADLRRPTLHRRFEVPNSTGLTALLTASGQALMAPLRSPRGENLDLLPAGTVGPALGEILDAPEFPRLLERWRADYHHVIFDAPAALEESSAVRLASMADAVILVLKAEHLPREVAQRAVELLRAGHATILGVVLNCRRLLPSWMGRGESPI